MLLNRIILVYHAYTFYSEFREASLATRTLFFVALICAFVALGLLLALAITSKPSTLTVSFLDVGQGDAIYIESPGGTDILIDGGQTRKVVRERAKLEPFWDRDIDLVVATHPDADHIGGLVDVLERLRVKSLLDTEVEKDTPVVQAYNRAVAAEKVREIEPVRGSRVVVDENVVLTILSRQVTAASDPNAASIVIRLDYGDTSFLFTGDADVGVERELLQTYEALDVDVLKVGHHGSDTSTSSEFVAAASPEVAVVSVGADNRYGLPDETVLNTLLEQGVEVLRTDEDGTLVFTSDGSSLKRSRIPLLQFVF